MNSLNMPGVIVVAPQPIVSALAESGIPWRVQPRVPSIREMWDGLSGGRLDTSSRVLVFSDEHGAGEAGWETELIETARAIVAMANAGAVVALVTAHPEGERRIREEFELTCARQGIDPQQVTYLVVAAQNHGEMTKAIAAAAQPFLPGDLPEAPVPRSEPLGIPPLPPIGGDAASITEVVTPSDSWPDQADRELLGRPRLPGQTTITVTSSKGGSGKSTVSVLLAATIARASKEAGRPLSVCLVDLDIRDGQVASLIGTFMPTALNIRVQPMWDEERIRRNLVSAETLGIETLLAPIRPRTADTVGPEFYRTMVQSLQRMFDVVVMDTSVQYLEPLIAKVALVEADEILFVTSLAATAVQGMARALREITASVDESGLGIPRDKIGIIVNQSVANVGMEQDQVLAAGLGVPVVGVIPLATRDVLTATNRNQMERLLDHPLLGSAYLELARACLPNADLADWNRPESGAVSASAPDAESAGDVDADSAESPGRRRLRFRKGR